MFVSLLIAAAFASDCLDFEDLEDPSNPCVDPAEGSLLETPVVAAEITSLQTSSTGVTAYIDQSFDFGEQICGDFTNHDQSRGVYPGLPPLIEGFPDITCQTESPFGDSLIYLNLAGDSWWGGCNWFQDDAILTLQEPESQVSFTYSIKAGQGPSVDIRVSTDDGQVQTFTGPAQANDVVQVGLDAGSLKIISISIADGNTGLLFSEFCWDGSVCEPLDADFLLAEDSPLKGRRDYQRQCKPGPPSTAFFEYWAFFQETSDYFSGEACANDECICDLLSINGQSPSCERAEGFFATLLLNLAEGNVAPCNCVQEYQSVTGVVAYVDSIMNSSPTDSECDHAAEVADAVNDALSIIECAPETLQAALLQVNH